MSRLARPSKSILLVVVDLVLGLAGTATASKIIKG